MAVLTAACGLSLRKRQKSKIHPGFFVCCQFEATPKLMRHLSSHESYNLPVWHLLFVGIVVLHKYTSVLSCVYVTVVKRFIFELTLGRLEIRGLTASTLLTQFWPFFLIYLFLVFSECSPRGLFPHRLRFNIILITFIINGHIFQHFSEQEEVFRTCARHRIEGNRANERKSRKENICSNA